MVEVIDPDIPVTSTKPGWKTTEFWLNLAAIVIAAVTPYIPSDNQAAKILSIAATLLAALGYTAGRSKVKAEAIRSAGDVVIQQLRSRDKT